MEERIVILEMELKFVRSVRRGPRLDIVPAAVERERELQREIEAEQARIQEQSLSVAES